MSLLPAPPLAGATAGKFALLGGGLILGLWNQIKLYSSKVYGLFIVRAQFQSQLRDSFIILICSEFKCSRIGTKNLTGSNEFVRPLSRNQLVGFEMVPEEPTLWWRNHKPILVASDGNGVSISFIRGVYSLQDLTLESINKFNKQKTDKDWKKNDRFFIRKLRGTIGAATGDGSRNPEAVGKAQVEDVSIDKYKVIPIGWNRSQIGQPKEDSASDVLSLKQDALDILKAAVLWRDHEEWFKAKSIPWKLGALFYGGPGTGKTAFTRALGQELNMPIFAFDLATMTNADFADAWEDMMSYTPCIPLFEDLDGVFHGRDNIAVKGLQNGLTFDCFLNHLDGVDNTDGIFIIVTTNKIETIDEAIGSVSNSDEISTRPGRIDMAVKFEALDSPGREKMATRILGDFPPENWKHLYKDGKNDSGAQFQERCCRYALNLFWEKKTGGAR